MRVLLCEAPETFLQGQGNTRPLPMLGLASIAAYLEREGHQVRLLLPDTIAYRGKRPWDELARLIDKERPEVIGISTLTATYQAGKKLAEVARRARPHARIILGGVHVSLDPGAALEECVACDFAVRGEGEETLTALLEALSHNQSLEEINGLSWRNGDEVVNNPRRAPIEDLDGLPPPKRDGLVHPMNHPTFYQSVMTVRGCPFECIYCAVPLLSSRRVRYRSVEHVVEEVLQLKARFKIQYLSFQDSVFTLKPSRTIALCEALVARGAALPFTCQTRADRVDDEVLAAMKRAGCQQIFLGIESGDPDSLERMHKGMPLDTIRAAIEKIKAHQIKASGFFMIGFPWEDEASMRKTADFATSAGLDNLMLFSATPLPGTELWTMTQSSVHPKGTDFRTPQLNLTSMSDASYATLYEEIRARLDHYNREIMLAQVMAKHGFKR